MSAIEKNVMNQISAGQIKMHSKKYYSIVGFISFLAIILFSFVSSYSMGVMALWVRIQSAEGYAYGAKRNLANLIEIFPWWALIFGLLSLFAAVYFVKKLGNLYKIRTIYLVIIILATSLVIGLSSSYLLSPSNSNEHNYNTNSFNIYK